MSQEKKQTYLILSLIGVLSSCAVLVFFSVFSGLTDSWEAKTVDYRFQLRGDVPADNGIILINCDDRSMRDLGRWPWDRSVHARMINTLSEAGAKNIAYDIIFSQPSDEEEDALLIESIKKSANVILPVGLGLSSEKTDAPLIPARDLAGFNTLPLDGSGKSRQLLLTATKAVFSLKKIAEPTFASGHISANRDQDGVIRRVPLVVDVAGKGLAAFGLVAAEAYLDREITGFTAGPEFLSIKEKEPGSNSKITETKIPVNERGMMLINYAGRWGHSFTHHSFSEILKTSETAEGIALLRKRFSGKLCLITNTATGFDIKTAPMEKDYPGGGIHANIINTILLKNFIVESGKGMTLSIVILMGLATGLLSSAENRITVFSALFGLVTIYLLAAFLFFTRLGYALPVLPPLMTVPLCSIMTSLYLLKIAHKRVGMLTEEKEELMLEFESVTSQLSNKEAQIAHLQDDLGDLRDQVLQDHKQEADQNNKIVDLESKIRQIVQERDFLKNKKDLLDQKLADLEIKEPEKLNLNSAELNQLKEECASFGIITANKKLLEAFRLLKKAAAVKSPVLILGEAGTGKELFASAVHRLSRRKERSLVTLNLPAITETLMESELFGHKKGAFTGANDNKIGKFEQAEGGSIFLDEIGEMKLELQSKLLRVLQTGEIDPVGGKTKKVDVRVIAATNKNLKQEVEKGSFRLDLFSRLNVITLTLPPLSERPEDVELLTNFYIQYFNQANERNITGVSEKAMEALKRYQWKGGNIRELRNTIDRGTIFAEGNLITEKDLNLAQDTPSERPPLKPVIQHQSADVSGDGAFLDLMRQKGFEINSVAGELKQSRGTVAARFKGICFHFLAEGRLDVSIAAKSVAGDEQKHELIERKILGYYKNLENICKDFSEKQGAIEECTKRFKNMPQAYHPALQEVINLHFKERK